MEAARQDVQEKAADELGGVECHGLEPIAAFDAVVLPFEGHPRLVEREEPGVGDRDAVGVARQVGEDGLRSGEGSLGEDHPVGAAQRRERGLEGALVGERGQVAEEGEPAGLVQRCEPFDAGPCTFEVRIREGKLAVVRRITPSSSFSSRGPCSPILLTLAHRISLRSPEGEAEMAGSYRVVPKIEFGLGRPVTASG